MNKKLERWCTAAAAAAEHLERMSLATACTDRTLCDVYICVCVSLSHSHTRALHHISLCIYKWNAEIKTFLRAVKGPDNTSVDIKITHIAGQALITERAVCDFFTTF
jgi:hypothetical protein